MTPFYFFPDYSRANPYQPMLYSRLSEVDAAPVPLTHLVKHLRDQVAAGTDPGVLHLHWTSPILQRAPGPFRAKLLLDRFTEALDNFKAAGGRLVWTVHNVLPHDGKHRWAEIELAQLLADRADIVHVLSAATTAAVGDLYRLDPAKVVVIEHCNFVGQYPDSMTRDEARARLGVLPGETALVALGGVRPYKGLDALLDAFDDLAMTDPGLRLLIAGKPIVHPEVDALRERCAGDPRVVAEFDFVPDDELQVWMRAADLAVLPYRDILNSGAFLLAQTFGLPVVGPRAGAVASWGEMPHVWLFDPKSPGSLRAAIAEALDAVRRDPAALREHALAAVRDRSVEGMGREFAHAVRELLSSGTGPTASAGSSRPPG